MVIDDDEDAIPDSDAFKPHIWRRANFMLMAAFVQFCLMVQTEFSYSQPFGEDVYMYIVLFKFIYMTMEEAIFETALVDHLQFAPMVSAVECISGG